MGSRFVRWLMMIAGALIGLPAFAVYTGPTNFNFEGFLLNDPSGTPMSGPVSLKFQIYDPTGSCLLFEETHASVNLDPAGAFSVKVGTGTRASSSVDGGLSWGNIFSNSSVLRGTGSPNCTPGYTPSPGHTRNLRVTVNGSTVLSPDFSLSSVPFATVADSVQGYGISDLVTKEGSAFLDGFLQFNNQKEIRFGDSTSANYVALRAPAFLGSNAVYTLPPTLGSPNQVLTTDGSGNLNWSTVSGGGGSATQLQGFNVSSSAPGADQVLMWNSGTNQWEPTTQTPPTYGMIMNSPGSYMTYQPGGTPCGDGETLRWEMGSGNWICQPMIDLIRNNGNSFSSPMMIGTTDNFPVRFIVNGTERMMIDPMGRIGIGTMAPMVSLDMGMMTDAIRIPSGTNAQRPTGMDGMIRYNTTSQKIEGYQEGQWVDLAEPPPDKGLQVFTTSGSFTVPTGVRSVKVIVIGGGGGGCMSMGNGGNGGAGMAYVNQLTPGQTISVNVGQGGTMGTNGSPGSPSSFGSYVNATPGDGCSAGVSGADGSFDTMSPPQVSGAPLDTLRQTYNAGMGGAMSVDGQNGIVIVEW